MNREVLAFSVSEFKVMFQFLSKLTRPRPIPNLPEPTVWSLSPDQVYIHATHPKAGSQWIQAILMDLFGAAAVPNLAGNGEPESRVFSSGHIYLSRYLAPDQLAGFAPGRNLRSFFVMRDLRDTLVSLYFSLKVSHEVLDEFMAGARARLNRVGEEDGLIYLIETQLKNSAKLQKSWLSHQPDLCLKFESITTDPVPEMTRILQQILDMDVPSEAVMNACERFAFERLAGGRKKGEEDSRSHFRSGAAGGWRKHFTPAVADAFADEFGDLLITANYERDTTWADEIIRPGRGQKS